MKTPPSSKVSDLRRFGLFKVSCLDQVPSLPASRANNIRRRGEETPSHPGGISDSARKRLEEFRKQRDRQKGEHVLFNYK